MSTGLKANSDGSAAIQVGGTDVITLTSSGAATFVTSPTTVQAGTAAAPAITTSGDTNTGIFFPAADTIAFAEGGVESMRIDSSGNLGLGVTPSAWGTASGQKAFQIGTSGFALSSSGAGSGDGSLTWNGYYNGTNWIYSYTGGAASRFRLNEAGAAWFTSSSGTAGNAITFTQAMTLDASGNLGIGTTSPAAKFEVSTAGSTKLRMTSTVDNNCDIDFYTNGTQRGLIEGNSVGMLFGTTGALPNLFITNNTERARITSGGTLLIAKTTDDFTSVGQILRSAGTVSFTCSNNENLDLNRLSTDGKLQRFFQDSIEEGNISVSGTAVSYNGGHLARYSQLLSGQRDESIVKGTVLSNLDDMCEWLDAEGNPLPNEQLNRMKVSEVEGDTNVAGVFVNWDNDDEDNPYDMNIAMTGDMIIRIAQGVTVQKGDLLMSAGDGTAKPQGDDIVRSKTVAKVTSNHVTCTYEDGSYCVPCVLMAC